jgi:hypothetical protein
LAKGRAVTKARKEEREKITLFAGVCNQNSGIEAETYNTKQTLVPDFSLKVGNSPELAELKVIGQAPSYYGTRRKGKNEGVLKKSGQIGPSYFRKCRNADAKYNGVVHGNGIKGPLERRLMEFGPIKALVIGPRGEGSPDLHQLIKEMAMITGERKWQCLGARGVVDAQGYFKQKIRRDIGIAAVRANAVLKRERIGMVHGDANAAFKRRNDARDHHRNMRQEYQELHRRGAGGY